MNLTKLFSAALCCALLAGCASTFGRSTDDPAANLRLASELFSRRDKPAEAEELILDTLKMCQKTGNRLGKAEAYRQYALLLRSYAVEKNERYYREEGFENKDIQFAKRYEKAIEYFIESREIFADYGRYDKLADIDIGMAKTYAHMNRSQEACDSLAKSEESYKAYKASDPDIKEYHAEELADYEEYLGILKQQLACPEVPVEKKEEVKEEPKAVEKPVGSHSMGYPEETGAPNEEKKPVGSHSMGSPQ